MISVRPSWFTGSMVPKAKDTKQYDDKMKVHLDVFLCAAISNQISEITFYILICERASELRRVKQL